MSLAELIRETRSLLMIRHVTKAKECNQKYLPLVGLEYFRIDKGTGRTRRISLQEYVGLSMAGVPIHHKVVMEPS